jgi:hypothetical protein
MSTYAHERCIAGSQPIGAASRRAPTRTRQMRRCCKNEHHGQSSLEIAAPATAKQADGNGLVCQKNNAKQTSMKGTMTPILREPRSETRGSAAGTPATSDCPERYVDGYGFGQRLASPTVRKCHACHVGVLRTVCGHVSASASRLPDCTKVPRLPRRCAPDGMRTVTVSASASRLPDCAQVLRLPRRGAPNGLRTVTVSASASQVRINSKSRT